MVAFDPGQVVAENFVLAVPKAGQAVAAIHWKRNQRVGTVRAHLERSAHARYLYGSARARPFPGVAQIAEMKVVDQMRCNDASQTSDYVRRFLWLLSLGDGLSKRIARKNTANIHLIACELIELIIPVTSRESPILAKIMIDTRDRKVGCDR